MGRPDSKLLSDLLWYEAQQYGIRQKLKQDNVSRWTNVFAESYFESTDACFKIQRSKIHYCQKLSRKLGKVVFDGMAVDGTVVDESGNLLKIFVMPDLQTNDNHFTNQLEEVSVDFSDNNQKRVLWEQQQKLLQEDTSQAKSLSATELLTTPDKQRIVLLGAPGSGKTTLVNYFLVTYAQRCQGILSDISEDHNWLPILIRIRDLARKPELSILDFIEYFVKTELGIERLPQDFFKHWLERNEAIILLDGLDEVPDSTQRRKTVEKIEVFLNDYIQCPVLITSRPAGYRDDYFSREEYSHYELKPFDDIKIDTFIDYWYDSRVAMKDERERRKSSLRKALETKPRIKKLGRNPLLLTIIALIHRYKAHLPKQRHELYHSAVETLISTWDKNKELTTDGVLNHLEIRDMRRLMEKLAYWIHQQGNANDESGTQIERKTLISQLSKFIQEIKAPEAIQLYQAQKEANIFLNVIIEDRAGLLSQQGQDRYAFVHKTFQEYLCAQEILYRQEDQDPDDDDYTPYVKNHIRTYLHNQHWQEVLLILVAQQAPRPAKSSLNMVSKARSEYECWLYRDLLFAGSCLAENMNISDDFVINNILNSLVRIEISDSPQITKQLRSRVFTVISSYRETPFASLVMGIFLQNQSSINRWRLIEYQIELMPERAKSRLLNLLDDDSADVRCRAASFLVNLNYSSDKVVHTLLSSLKNNAPTVRYSAAAALGNLNNASDKVIPALLDLLKDESATVRYSAAASLGNISNVSENIIDALLSLLKDKSDTIRARTAESLGNLGNDSDKVIHALLNLLKDNSATIRASAAISLGNLGKASDEVIQALLRLLKDESATVRHSAIVSLENLSNASSQIVQSLLNLLQDHSPTVRARAAIAIGILGHSSHQFILDLLKLLGDDSETARYAAATTLGTLGNTSEKVIQALLSLLEDNSATVRYSAAESLRNLGITSDRVVYTLLSLLRYESLFRYRPRPVNDQVIKSLVACEKNSSLVEGELVKWIQKNSSKKFVSKGIDALWEIIK